MKQNVVVQSAWGSIKVQFEHCPVCKYFGRCYVEDGWGPRYIDEGCANPDNFPNYYKQNDRR